MSDYLQRMQRTDPKYCDLQDGPQFLKFLPCRAPTTTMALGAIATHFTGSGIGIDLVSPEKHP